MNAIKENLYKEIKQQELSIDRDVFDYGIAILMQYFLCLVFSFAVGYQLDCVLEMVITIIIWTGVRRYIGGFHFENSWICLFFSVLINACISKLSQFLSMSLLLDVLLSLISLIIIISLGCVDHKNKPLSIAQCS